MIYFLGRELYNCIHSDSASGFTVNETSSFTPDHLSSLEHVKKAVEILELKLDRIQSLWQQRDREISRTVRFDDLEHNMKTVSLHGILHRRKDHVENKIEIPKRML